MLDLAHQIHASDGPETAPPLLIAHGLFGQARNFATLAKRFAVGRRVVAVDMRNHGDSPWDSDVSYYAQASDLARTIEAQCGGRAAVLGHSMGGKAAMELATVYPERVADLIVADIAPVEYTHTHAGYIAAMQGLDLGALTRRSEADALLAEAIPDKPVRQFLLQNLAFEGGVARWRLNLAALGAGMATLIGFPAFETRYQGRALFLYGSASDYVAPWTHSAIHTRFPEARIEAIEGAGHWLHAERPEAFAKAVLDWLAKP
ncbi:MAG: alpha/beta fold hydrolase [Pseudomonadota bacterium]